MKPKTNKKNRSFKDRPSSSTRKKPFENKRNSKPLVSSLLNEGEYLVEGSSVVGEYVRQAPNAIVQIYCSSRALKPFKQDMAGQIKGSVLELTDELKESFRTKSPVIAIVKHSFLEEADFFSEIKEQNKPECLIIALDQVQDPRNFGAIARTAAFYGCPYILMPRDNSASFSYASVLTAQGAFTRVKVVSVTNLGRTLDELKEDGFWVVSADMGGVSVEKADLSFDKKILVMGNEGKGVRAGIIKKSDLVVSVGSKYNFLESLNVSVAAGILIHECRR